jgi:hypothetical protein
MKRISGAYLHARMNLSSVVVLREATMLSTKAKKVTCFVKSYTTSAVRVFEREQAATQVVWRSTRSSCSMPQQADLVVFTAATSLAPSENAVHHAADQVQKHGDLV